ncbi:hypothetical protein NC653_031521 [Populus alba x Populus x berolinensis]|uniref:Transmembrane protein n=1 Tax=Populus alba x Populus x berolinensis TaxID=444605 RepID=A0AAD6LZ06_9ROSI|nr:hypothetical protein NC653_031521 [Populus alba x Populus x berolinensis]
MMPACCEFSLIDSESFLFSLRLCLGRKTFDLCFRIPLLWTKTMRVSEGPGAAGWLDPSFLWFSPLFPPCVLLSVLFPGPSLSTPCLFLYLFFFLFSEKKQGKQLLFWFVPCLRFLPIVAFSFFFPPPRAHPFSGFL